MLESRRTWKAPTVLESYTEVSFSAICHPPFLKVVKNWVRSTGFSVYALSSVSTASLREGMRGARAKLKRGV